MDVYSHRAVIVCLGAALHGWSVDIVVDMSEIGCLATRRES